MFTLSKNNKLSFSDFHFEEKEFWRVLTFVCCLMIDKHNMVFTFVTWLTFLDPLILRGLECICGNLRSQAYKL